MFVRSINDFHLVKRLSAAGASTYAIAARTGLPRSTVQRWCARRTPPRNLPSAPAGAIRPPDRVAYAYLLGVDLGDGNVWQTGAHSWRLCLTLDAAYPGIVEEVRAAVARVVPHSPVHVNKRSGCNAFAVLASSERWPRLLPQHGPGRKHERKIELVGWQRRITTAHVRPLLRGLIHSDGCRSVNRFRTRLPSGRVAEYAYPRYFFSNASADIRRIFCEHCELLGVRWTRSNARNVSVSHRDSVAALDAFIGPKR